MFLKSVMAVFWFEWYRALTAARLAWWALLALFPAGIIVLIRLVARHRVEPVEPWTVLLFALIPMLVSMLGTFLWASPAVSSELEGRSWVYLAVRPHGTSAVLIGKYLATVTWVLSASLVALAAAVAIMPHPDAFRIGGIVARITFLSVPAYGAVYLLLGTLFPKRSMVIAVAYTLVFEFVVSMIPALVNTLTVQFRIRTLLWLWADLPLNGEVNALLAFVGDPPAWEHVFVLVAYTLVLVIAAVGVAQLREFPTSEEGEG